MSDIQPNQHKFIFDVRYHEKDVAKKSGLKWDPTLKKWYQWVENNNEIMKHVLDKIKDIPFKVYDIVSDYYDAQPDQKDILIRASIKHYKSFKNIPLPVEKIIIAT